jgi:segregation and condensation protein A
LDIAGDFLVMAATLMQIKAKMLHPDNEKDAVDADTELNKIKAKLLEYQKYKEVSKILSNKEQQYSQTYYRPHPVIDEQDYQIDATIFDLVKAFQEALRTLPEEVREIMYKEIPIEVKIREILDLLEGRQFLSFSEIVKLQPSRTAMVVSFMALLEDIRLYRVYNNEQEESQEKDELDLNIQNDNIVEETQEVQIQPEPLELEAEKIDSQEDENNEDINGN